ncbi:helix-turn-helix domain-containing protein [Oceanobacillus caeni]|uniref:Transcriptional regulator n=1 Tax=Oceanobacillus caeni TaxID=405946 RepID=A0ABR5MGN7_9BACI|nr:helix-turn-helix domain-containing protein [Oceanobacillus caeni]KPH71809.1 transcriptional regulator [Oceanobacillus caeni]
MIEIGSFIKLQRTKKGMTLGELADGIVSVSYLSKIENLKTQASPEIIQLLCNKLGINVDKSKEPIIKEKCDQWFSMLFEVNDKEDIIVTYKELQELMDTNISDYILLFEIHKIRYYLLIGETSQAYNKMEELNEMSDDFDNIHKFYWFKYRGNYYSVKEDYSNALEMYNQAETLFKFTNLEEHEIADVYYLLAVTHSKLRNTLESIDFANKALEVYMKQYNFVRCAQCHNILGISYRRIRMYEKAIKNYNLALHLGELNNNKAIIQLTNQNLGHLYSVKGDSEEAIKHYLEVLNDSEVSPSSRLTTLASSVSEYYQAGRYEEAKETIHIAFELMKELKEETHRLSHYTIHIYHHLLNEEWGKFENVMVNELLPYLKKTKDYANIIIFSSLLADFFEKRQRYKDAAKYYKVVNFAYRQIANI